MFSIKNLVLVSAIILLFTSVILQFYNMYGLSTSKAFVWNGTDPNKADTKGLEAQQFWASNQFYIIGPSIGNLISMVLLGVLFTMG